MAKAFRCFDTVKIYPEFQLGPLNLELEPGTVLGYIGPNGSGKSTTLHCLAGLVKTDSGRIEIFGRENDPMKPEWKLDIGYVGDEHVFYERWSGEKNLKFISQFYPSWSGDSAAETTTKSSTNADTRLHTTGFIIPPPENNIEDNEPIINEKVYVLLSYSGSW